MVPPRILWTRDSRQVSPEPVGLICCFLHLFERRLQPRPEESVRTNRRLQEVLPQPLREVGALQPDTSMQKRLP